MKKIRAILIAIMVVCIPMSVKADAPLAIGETFVDGYLTYEVIESESGEPEVEVHHIEKLPSGIPEIIIPGSVQYNETNYQVTTLGMYAFQETVSTIILEEGVKYILEKAFINTYATRNLILPSTLQTLGSGYEFKKLQSIELNTENPYFDLIDGALYSEDHKQLYLYPSMGTATSFRAVDGVEVVKSKAFYYNSSLEVLEFPDTLKEVEDYSILSYVTSKLKKVDFGDGLETLGVGAASGLVNLEELNLGSSLKKIGNDAIGGLYSLKTLHLPKTVESIGRDALLAEYALEEIIVEDGNPNFYSKDGILYERDTKGDNLVLYPAAKSGSTYVVPDTVYGTYQYSIEDCLYLEKLILPKSVQYINQRTVYNPRNPITIIFKHTKMPEYMATNAFYLCSALEGHNIVFRTEELKETLLEQVPYFAVNNKYVDDEGNLAENKDDYIKIEARHIPATDLVVEPGALEVEVGKSETLLPKITPVDANDIVTFESTNSLIARVDAEGVVTGIRNGSTTIAVALENGTTVDVPVTVTGTLELVGEVYLKDPEEIVYTGLPHAPDITYSCGQQDYGEDGFIPCTHLIKGVDYEVSYEQNINAGEAKIILTGIGTYQGRVEGSFPILARDLSDDMVSEVEDQIYTGTPVRPEVTVTWNGKKLLKDVDYTLTYKGAETQGSANVTITGIGNFSGIIMRFYTIIPGQNTTTDINDATCTTITETTYTGSKITPDVTVQYKDKTLVKNIDYKLVYEHNIEVGTATIRVQGIGNFHGETVLTFRIKGSTNPIQEKWVKIGKDMYYQLSNGSYAKGWKQIEKHRYYFNQKGVMQKDWVNPGGKWYYLNQDGVMQKGWQQIRQKWYYLGTDGVMLTNWQKIGGKWYYMNKSGMMLTGWQRLGGKWYYMNKSGMMLTGWQRIGGRWYYMNKSGMMLTGWNRLGGKWYYMNKSGMMLTRWQRIGGKWYYLYLNGVMAANTWIGNCYVNASGVWVRSR